MTLLKTGGHFAERCRAATKMALAGDYLAGLFPEGQKIGRELRAGDIYGADGHSFSVNLDTGRWLDFAHAGLKGGDIVDLVARRYKLSRREALERLEMEFGLTPAGLPDKPGRSLPPAPTTGRPSRVWRYTDEDGHELYQARRWDKPGHTKSCRLIGLTAGTKRVPLYLPEILSAVRARETIYLAEGEPKADLLRSWGLAATTFAGGVNGYQRLQPGWFAGSLVVIVVDSDRPGRDFGRRLAADLLAAGQETVKVVELPGADFEGFDLIDWHKNGGTAEQLVKLVESTPPWGGQETMPDHQPPDVSEFLAGRYLDQRVENYRWLIQDSLRRGQLGLICGPPGCGKGFLALQLAAGLAAGAAPLDFWAPSETARVLFVSAEDDQDVLRHRLHHAFGRLPEKLRDEAARRAWAVPIRGRVSLCRIDRAGVVRPTENYDDLKRLIAHVKPDLVILDTMARLFEVNENDNPAMAAACGLMEEIAQEYGCNIIFVHHAAKSGGDLAADRKSLKSSLSQMAIRGASALAACVRWVLMMAPLADNLAARIIGPAAGGKPPGAYVAVRVAKKNAGPSEEVLYLERDEHGLLSRVSPAGENSREETTMADARHLAAEVRRRLSDCEPALTASGPQSAFGWGAGRTKKAVDLAVVRGLVSKKKKTGGRGHFLVPAGSDPVILGR